MCDYSLEMYRSQPAQEGVEYQTHRFPSRSIGFVSPADASTAVCMACGMKLKLQGIPDEVQNSLGVKAEEVVTFIRIESGMYHDGVRFANDAEVTLQRLGTGVKAQVVDALSGPHEVGKTLEAV